MPVVTTRYDAESPKVAQDGIHYPAFQAMSTTSVPSVFQVPITPAVATNGFQNRNSITFDLENSEVATIESAYFRIKLSTASSTLTLAPCPDWFEDILIEADKGLSAELARIYPVTVYMWAWSMYNEEQREDFAYRSGFKYVKNDRGEVAIQQDRDRTRLVSGAPKEFWMPIPLAWMHMSAIDMRHVINDIRFKLRLTSVTNIVLSGTATDLQVDDITLVINSMSELPFDNSKTLEAQASHPHGYVYLDTELLSYNNKTLNASAKTKYDLDSFVGKAACLVSVVKDGTEPLTSSRFRFLDLSDDAKLDLETSSGVSLYGEGTAVPLSHIKSHLTNDLGTRPVVGLNVLSFADAGLKEAFSGVISGFHQMIGNKTYLTVDYPAAPVAAVHTITMSGAATAGVAAFEVAKETDASFTFNDAVGVLKAAYEAHPQVQDRGYEVTFGSTFAAGATVALTYAAKHGYIPESERPKVIAGNLDEAWLSTAITTAGSDGWVSSASYTTEIYMFKYRELVIDKDGRLLVRDL